MPAMNVIAWIHFIAAGILAVMAFNSSLALISPAIAALIAGFLFLAIDKGLTLLAEIRDRLPATAEAAAEPTTRPDSPTPVRSLAEVEADVARMRARTSA